MQQIALSCNVSLEDLARQFWLCDFDPTCSYQMDAQSQLFSLEINASHSFSTGKLALVNGASQATFLFTVRDLTQHKSIPLDIDYVISDMEFDIASTAIDDYRESMWLSFIRPLDTIWEQNTQNSTRIGQIRIPVPWHGMPQTPIVSKQAATMVSGDNSHKQWKYELHMDEHDFAAQDSAFLHIGFNITSDLSLDESSNTPQPPTALLEKLAQFITVYPAIPGDRLKPSPHKAFPLVFS